MGVGERAGRASREGAWNVVEVQHTEQPGTPQSNGKQDRRYQRCRFGLRNREEQGIGAREGAGSEQGGEAWEAAGWGRDSGKGSAH